MRQYRGGYGHHPSGKLYTYWGPDNISIGQNVVAPVTHWKTKKTYNTMFTPMMTNAADSPYATIEAHRLSQQGIGLKSIKGTNIMELPGALGYSSKSGWTRQSNIEYRERIARRLGETYTPRDTLQARTRLLEG